MKCVVCGSNLSGPEPRTVPYHSLPGVNLVGVPVWTCGCGEEEISIPDINGLDRLIVHLLSKKNGSLSGSEIRFLRKHIGWSGRDLARHLDVAPATVSRWENDEQRIGPQADRLLRLLATRLEPIASYEELDRLFPSEDEAPGVSRPEWLTDHWECAA